MTLSTKPRSPGGEPPSRRRTRSSVTRAYCRLTLAFVVGVYLPWAASAPDLWRHFGEAVHSWAILFFAPIAAWRLLRDARGRTRRTVAVPDAR
jgi:hypothetical protein